MKNGDNILTLEQALEQPRRYRDMDLALTPMDNYSKTPGWSERSAFELLGVLVPERPAPQDSPAS